MHPGVMTFAGYFKGSKLAQMSNGTYCIIRDLGLAKGEKGLRASRKSSDLERDGPNLEIISPATTLRSGTFCKSLPPTRR
jgi:hypothetical protein